MIVRTSDHTQATGTRNLYSSRVSILMTFARRADRSLNSPNLAPRSGTESAGAVASVLNKFTNRSIPVWLLHVPVDPRGDCKIPSVEKMTAMIQSKGPSAPGIHGA